MPFSINSTSIRVALSRLDFAIVRTWIAVLTGRLILWRTVFASVSVLTTPLCTILVLGGLRGISSEKRRCWQETGTPIELTIDRPMDGLGRNSRVSVRVDDADAYYREWGGKVTLLRAPKHEGWGARTFGLLDPSGHPIFVMGPLTRTNRR